MTTQRWSHYMKPHENVFGYIGKMFYCFMYHVKHVHEEILSYFYALWRKLKGWQIYWGRGHQLHYIYMIWIFISLNDVLFYYRIHKRTFGACNQRLVGFRRCWIGLVSALYAEGNQTWTKRRRNIFCISWKKDEEPRPNQPHAYSKNKEARFWTQIKREKAARGREEERQGISASFMHHATAAT